MVVGRAQQWLVVGARTIGTGGRHGCGRGQGPLFIVPRQQERRWSSELWHGGSGHLHDASYERLSRRRGTGWAAMSVWERKR
jgi:hypothetical protein